MRCRRVNLHRFLVSDDCDNLYKSHALFEITGFIRKYNVQIGYHTCVVGLLKGKDRMLQIEFLWPRMNFHVTQSTRINTCLYLYHQKYLRRSYLTSLDGHFYVHFMYLLEQTLKCHPEYTF